MKRAFIGLWSLLLAACGTKAEPAESGGRGGQGGQGAQDGQGGQGAQGGQGGDGSDAPVLGADQTVTAFEGTHVYFGKENRRVVDAPVSFPASGPLFDRITMRLSLRCPNGRCDFWDRVGWLSVVRGSGEQATEIEIARFVTPYRVEGAWELDVTDLRPLLAGDVTVRVFIDTWVGPGHPNGDGWLVDTSFEFHGGKPVREAVAAIPVWTVAEHEHGDPEKQLALSSTVELPAAAGSMAVRTLVTGHGQGNSGNCAEFCPLEHRIGIGAETRARAVWRDDCRQTAVPNQAGTWQYPRAGWCPGALVVPWVEEVQTGADAGAELALTYGVETYENTCRPDAATCTGCTLGSSCEYNDGSHTPPKYYVSSLLIMYR